MKWIKHDTDANQDAKLQNVLLDYGLEGYGLYWYCIELIAGKVDKENITFELEHDARIIARNTGSTPQKVEEMMRYFVDIGLFENCSGVITCLKLAKRLDKSMTSNPEMRKIIEKLKNHDSVMIESEKPMQDKIRLEESIKDSSNLPSKSPTPYREIIKIYSEVLPELPAPKKLTPERQSAIRARHNGDFKSDLNNWRRYFEYIRTNCTWMLGQSPKNYFADIDYLTRQKTVIGVMEGAKDDR